MQEESKMAIPCNIIQEYVAPPGITAVRIEVESGGSGGHSSSNVTIQVRPGAAVRLRLVCLPAQDLRIPNSPPRDP